MADLTLTSAEAYYKAILAKDFLAIEGMLSPDIRLISPLAEIQGVESVLGSIKAFSAFLKGITIRARFGSRDQAMLAYEMECPLPIGSFQAAVLMTFKDDLIARIELFYDARRFEKSGIFSK